MPAWSSSAARPPACAVQSALRGLIVTQRRRPVAETRNDKSQIVAAASDMIIASLPDRLPLAQVALKLGLTVGALEAAFRDIGLKPRRYIRQRRFQGLHADLAAGRFATVEDALFHWGFPALSKSVRHEYSRMFGDTVEETLQNSMLLHPSAIPPGVSATTCS